MAANDQAHRLYQIEPFTDAPGTAIFDGQYWTWRKRVGYGRGDLEAAVRITPNGRIDSVDVRQIVLELTRGL